MWCIAHRVIQPANLAWNCIPSSRVCLQAAHLSFEERRNKKRAARMKQYNSNAIELPTINVLLRQLYRRAHPDILRASHPALADINDDSMQTLNGVLSTIKEAVEGNEYPPQIVKSVPFHMKNTKDTNKIDCVELNIKTAGGDSRKQLMTSFERFFVESDISKDGRFLWGKDYFSH